MNSEATNLLIGTWSIDETIAEVSVDGVDIVTYLVNNYGYDADSAQTELDLFTELMHWENEGTINFKSDNTYYAEFTNTNESEDGTWTITNDGKTLKIFFDNEEDRLNIQNLSASAATFNLPTETEDADLDDDGVNETTLDINVSLKLSK